MERKIDIVGLGNPLLDMICNVDEEYLKKYNLKNSNAILASREHMSIYDEITKRDDVKYLAGGSCQNTIRAAQWMLGDKGKTKYFGCVGKDRESTILRNIVENEGVIVDYCVDEENATGKCAVLVCNKERSLVAHLSACTHYKPEHFDSNLDTKVLYITGFFISSSMETIRKAISLYQSTVTICFNLSATFVIQYNFEEVMDIINYSAIVFGNREEAVKLGEMMNVDSTDLSSIADTLSWRSAKNCHPKIVIFTDGPNDVLISIAGKSHTVKVPVVKDEDIVDLNGAGDCFVGGFLYKYCSGYQSIEECVKAGNYCASVCIKTSGVSFEGKPDEAF